ncbi:hypothetical protein Y88_2668 [Novosphingobium nitrogenifigens DSM 19370]|uniref:Uncharacterized protein n=1 Tax=Novosphingobium nitrogenifigens DSM 19370 TaxID=983920 RepID=F1Z721_9SPHN|nr:hypothetical protein [Novosphingobium nitrogenifigens]EGD59624.1 hypothetical protein Y88_2668 [Novosphingobium nitrogenifigens DSM 19370]
MLIAIALAMTPVQGGHLDYAHAMDCAVGEAVLARLLADDSAAGSAEAGSDEAGGDRAQAERLAGLARYWFDKARAQAPDPSTARADFARRQQALGDEVAASRDAASLQGLFEARLAPCEAAMAASSETQDEPQAS